MTIQEDRKSKDESINLFKRRTEDIFIQLGSILVDALFLGFWLIIQCGLNLLISKLMSFKIDQLQLLMYKHAFAISTFVPVCLNIAADIVCITRKSIERIRGRE